jgi:hypothetical protein
MKPEDYLALGLLLTLLAGPGIYYGFLVYQRIEARHRCASEFRRMEKKRSRN